MSATIKRFDCGNGNVAFCQGCYQMEECQLGDYVLHSDHIASHAFDEAKERELFEAKLGVPDGVFFSESFNRYRSMNGRIYEVEAALDANLRLESWLACARSRAERFAGGAE